ncbi:hypothetical protein ACHAXA_011629 [Cyclostephanos tholiformis]|uniref:Fe2OG dioxygenase domain-containing protein n=1 Tax=Cyclostephanos tholiformis TaxID=382380 RepID=A0ABD3RV95_9STRA
MEEESIKRQQPANKRSRTNDKNEVSSSSSSSSSSNVETNNGTVPSYHVDNTNNDDDESVLYPISPLVLSRANEFSSSYRDNLPYPHGIIREFCRGGFLESVLSELKNHTRVKFKETDLFRVYQSIDLGNLQRGTDLATKMPSLMRLKDALYSSEYRSFVESISGLDPGTLTDEVDCAANCHAKGCHLLCHDDVIGTRAISYILYLTDGMPMWKDEYGGRLELYDAVPEGGGAEDDDDDDDNDDFGNGPTSRRRRWVPSAIPSKAILPEFNSLAYFAVKPGVSFHSVQEVFVSDRPRLSIQGWYHAKCTPFDIDNATLRRLKSSGRGEDTEGDFVPLLPDPFATSSRDRHDDDDDDDKGGGRRHALNHAEITFLRRYINDTYLTKGSMDTIRERFEEDSSVKLRHFLNDEWNDIISRSSSREDERDMLGNDRPALDYRVGTMNDGNRWRVVGPAHKQRFLEYDDGYDDGYDGGYDDDDGKKEVDEKVASDATSVNDRPGPSMTTGDGLRHLRRVVFRSAAFGRWLGSVTSLGPPLGHRGRIRRFRPGLDYTVAHHGILTRDPVLDATLCFCAGDGRQCKFDEETNDLLGSDDDAIWESGDVGGFECYIAADDDGKDGGGGGPDDEYDEEDDTKLLSVSASNNTLSLVYRDPGTMRFVKYVGAGAPSSRWDIALEYDVNSTEDPDSEQHEDDDE